MKFLFLPLLFASAALASCQNETVTRDMAQLPQQARSFVEQHFSGHPISYVKIDKEWLDTEYKVVLTNGDEVAFDADGDWKKVECKRSAVSLSVIVPKVASYVQQNFPTDSVASVEMHARKIEVELYNGLKLVFDSEGNLKRLKD